MFKLGFGKNKASSKNVVVDEVREDVPALSRSTLDSVENPDDQEILAFSGELRTLVDKVNRDVANVVLELFPNVEKLSSELQSKIPQFESVYNKMCQLESANAGLEEENVSLTRRVDVFKIKIVEMKRTLESALHRSNELVASNEALNGELDYHRRELNKAIDRIEETEHKLNESLKRESVLGSREKHLVEQISELKDLFYEEKRLKSSYANDATEAKIAMDDMRASYDKVRKLLEEEKATSARAKSEYLIVANDHEILVGKYRSLETEIVAVRERYELQIENITAQYANSEEKRYNLERKIEFHEKRYSNLLEKYNSTHSYVSDLQRHNNAIAAKEVFGVASGSELGIDFQEDDDGSHTFVNRAEGLVDGVEEFDRGILRFSAKNAADTKA